MLASAPGGWTPAAEAAWGESMVMPGKLAAKHARYEGTCLKCHDPLDQSAQERLCLDCHKDVAADVGGKLGYHGQAPAVQGVPCRKCHAEHKGREADIVRLDRKQFDHRLTDRLLQGGHVQVRCEECHKTGKRYREAPPHCSDCHRRKDPHEGTQGAACDTCHTEAAWKTVRFDHNTAAFHLEGKHREARCQGCHKTKRYKPTPTDCFACHERHDKHRGSFGNACHSCHTARGWVGTEYDHAGKTKFPLLGKHLQTPCRKCHTGGLAAARTPTTCVGCHERTDAHHGRFGPACEKCHTPTEWRRPTFEHDAPATKFPLRARHQQVRCPDCHRGNAPGARLDTSCSSCHRVDDVHRGRQGTRCDKCHDERGWNRDVLFDHGATRFPLVGAHDRIACKLCHVSPVLKEVGHECVACHAAVSRRRCGRGAQCERCHDTSSFRSVRAPQ